MTPRRTPLVIGNWKMNGLRASLDEIGILVSLMAEDPRPKSIAICPPSTLLYAVSKAGDAAGVLTGGQDCHEEPAGAHTGDVSAEMLRDAGARYCIVGHSERRLTYGESDARVNAKARAAIRAGLVPIICVGETLAQRQSGHAVTEVATQIAHSVPDEAQTSDVVIAYEPVWAIGTGLTPQLDDIRSMHFAIRNQLMSRFPDKGAAIQVLYGGSLKPSNAADILALPNVDGGLVGGASLRADELFAIAVA